MTRVARARAAIEAARQEIAQRAALGLQAARESEVDEIAAGSERAGALALLPKCVLDEPIGRGLRGACARMGIRLECRECYSGFAEQYGTARNIVTWGMRWRHAQYVAGGRNVLFVENGLLRQRHGRYVDHAGYFADSSIATAREWERPVSASERDALWEHVQREFGVPASHPDPDGPILVALQTPVDAPLRHYCTRLSGDGRQYVIDAAAQYLPHGAPVIVRPHPGDRDWREAEWRIPDGWTVDRSPDVYALLRRCRAMVTANSTLSFEALALGLPVACLGRHAYTGSGAVLECDGAPSRLADLLAWHPDPVVVEGLLAAVMRHQIWVRAGIDDWLRCASFVAWAERCLGGPRVPVSILADSDLGQRYEAAAMRLRAGADSVLQDLADATAANLDGTCPSCSRGRLMQRIVDQDLAAHGGREPVFGHATIERLQAAGLDIMRPDLAGYRERWKTAAASSTAPRPEIGIRAVLGYVYGGHLGDMMCATPLAQPLIDAGIDVRVVRHRNTYAAFAGHRVTWQNDGRIRLGPPQETGKGHLIQRILRWFGLPESPYPRPDIRVDAEERAWAEELLGDLPRPRIVVCPEAVSNADGYAEMPWQSWVDALRSAGSVIQVRQHGPELGGCRVVSGLSIRQFLVVCAAVDAYLGTYAAGIHAAAAFGLEAIVVCTARVNPADLVFPSPQRHIVSFLYPQHGYGWFRAGASGRTTTPVFQSTREVRTT